jgi:hypothetical protein
VELWEIGSEKSAGFFADTDIKEGEELTINYGWDRAMKKMACYCNAPNCTGFLGIKQEEKGSYDAIPLGIFRMSTSQERDMKHDLVNRWVQVLWDGDKGDKVELVGLTPETDAASPSELQEIRKQNEKLRRKVMNVTSEGTFYTGRVAAFNEVTGVHMVHYVADDDEVEEDLISG